MAGWNGVGGFDLNYLWTNDAANGIAITASRMDTQESTIAVAGFGNCMTRDAQGVATAIIPFPLGINTDTVNPYTALGPVTFSAGQIGFPATQNPSASANVLDDYEEGIFTPVLDFGGGTTGITYSIQDGAYTKIGNVVNFWIQLQLTSKGSSTGISHVTALPFAVGRLAAVTFYADGVVISGAIQAFAENATTSIRLVGLGTGTVGAMLDTNFTNTSLVLLSGSYRV